MSPQTFTQPLALFGESYLGFIIKINSPQTGDTLHPNMQTINPKLFVPKPTTESSSHHSCDDQPRETFLINQKIKHGNPTLSHGDCSLSLGVSWVNIKFGGVQNCATETSWVRKVCSRNNGCIWKSDVWNIYICNCQWCFVKVETSHEHKLNMPNSSDRIKHICFTTRLMYIIYIL